MDGLDKLDILKTESVIGFKNIPFLTAALLEFDKVNLDVYIGKY